MSTERTTLLAAIDRRLWRDLGFAAPEPEILRFLPSLAVAWSDGTMNPAERELIEEHGNDLPEHLQSWLGERLRYPPGPYFRYQVAHLIAFLQSVWPAEDEWAEEGEQWASELIQDASWLRRWFGGLRRERRQLEQIREVMRDAEILATDRVWALARGAHAEFEPRHAAVVGEYDDQLLQGIGIVLEGPGERVAVGSQLSIVQGEDLDREAVVELLARSAHLREPERWILLGGLVHSRGRPPTDRQVEQVDALLQDALGMPFESVHMAELQYLEDALAVDARWMSWCPGVREALRIDREGVERLDVPGTFTCPRDQLQASVAKEAVVGPSGLGFRVLTLSDGRSELRLAAPVLLREPATNEAIEWVARFLPATCDPCQQLVLDLEAGTWIAEVFPRLPRTAPSTPEPLGGGRALLVPPWAWFRAAGACGVRYFSGRRRQA